jgi:glyoxylase-like metal-dependent hydrolase (beta-lactamase superfamily II)
MGRAITIGDVEVISLADAEGSFATFPHAFKPDDEVTALARKSFGDLFRGDDHYMPFFSFLIRAETTILIDAGLGPPPGEEDFVPDRQGWLLDQLAATGTQPDDVDTVFLTHLHADHIGWSVTGGHPTFPRAIYITHRSGWEWNTKPSRAEYAALLAPLEESGALTLIDGDGALAPSIKAFETPGHAPGHMAVDISSGGERIVILGDVVVHPIQLTYPDCTYFLDDDAELAARTRADLVAKVAVDDPIVACGHFPAGCFGRLAQTDPGPLWQPLEQT